MNSAQPMSVTDTCTGRARVTAQQAEGPKVNKKRDGAEAVAVPVWSSARDAQHYDGVQTSPVDGRGRLDSVEDVLLGARAVVDDQHASPFVGVTVSLYQWCSAKRVLPTCTCAAPQRSCGNNTEYAAQAVNPIEATRRRTRKCAAARRASVLLPFGERAYRA